MTHRDQLGSWLNAQGLTDSGAEVGCSHCGHAKQIASQWRGKTLFLVDLWARQASDIYREDQQSASVYEAWWRECSEFAASDGRVILVREQSPSAARHFGDESLDWAYIDANHSQEAVTADLDAWWPKVRAGGLFGGHDFYNKTTEGHHCFVQEAVLAWAGENRLNFSVTPCSSWWIYK